jgi:hypothetical protein
MTPLARFAFLDLSVVLGLSLAACGARTGFYDAASDAGHPLPFDGGAALDAPGVSADASGGTIDAPTGPALRYGVLTGEGTRSDLSGPDDAFIAFYPEDGLPPACALAGPSGQCSVVTCPVSQSASSSLPASANAGTVTASVGTVTASMSYAGTSPTGTYEGAYVNAIYTTGDTMRFHGPGGPDVPPFDVSVSAPDLVELDPPWFTTEVTIDTTKDLPLSWGAAPSGGDAVFTVADAAGHELVCFFDARPGGAVVKEADLAAFKALVGGAAVNAEFLVANRAQTSVPGWQLEALGIVWFGADVSQYGAVILE